MHQWVESSKVRMEVPFFWATEDEERTVEAAVRARRATRECMGRLNTGKVAADCLFGGHAAFFPPWDVSPVFFSSILSSASSVSLRTRPKYLSSGLGMAVKCLLSSWLSLFLSSEEYICFFALLPHLRWSKVPL